MLVQCTMCNQKKEIHQSDLKTLDRDGDFVCSAECLIDWVRQPRDFELKRDVPKSSYQINAMNGGGCTSERLHCSFRSGYEASVAEYLYDHNIMFLYEYVTFTWGSKQYTPDFFLYEYGCFVEPKGKWQPSARSKYKSFRENFPKIPMIVAHWLLAQEIPKAHILGG